MYKKSTHLILFGCEDVQSIVKMSIQSHSTMIYNQCFFVDYN